MSAIAGRVIIVGAGPGDPGLITVRGAKFLREADVILYDYLASSGVLEHVREDAQLVCLGRHGQGRLWTQQEINARLIAEARQGRTVVRLKGGDPAIFGRLTDELGALAAAGVPFEIVPGITAALAASSYSGIPLTDRDAASCVTFVTGHESDDKNGGRIDYDALAKVPGTLVFYMGVTTAQAWSRALLDAGKPPATAAAVVRRCSLPDQQIVHATLADVPQMFAAKKIRPPAVVIIGDVARRGELYDWFTRRSLFGQKVLVTRPSHQTDSMVADLAQLGAHVFCQPAIEIAPPRDWSNVDEAQDHLGDFDWVVFSSSNGVRFFLNRLCSRGFDMRALGGIKVAAIGPATVAALGNYTLTADISPQIYRAEALAEALAPFASGKRFLLVRASRGREILAQLLSAEGGSVEQIVAYTSHDVPRASTEIIAALDRGEIDWVTVTSSAIARSLVAMFGHSLARAKLAAISPLTADVLREHGLEPAVVADVFTATGLIRAIEAHARPSASS